MDSDDPADREGHRTVARWLKHFTGLVIPNIIAQQAADRAKPSTEGNGSGGTPYMEHSPDLD